MSSNPASSVDRRNGGFSLVEVTMSIGIVSFAFVALFALLPVGMTQFREAMDSSVKTQIIQRVVADAQQTDFDLLRAKPTEIRYFDDQGTDLGAEPHSNSIYTVEVVVQAATQIPAQKASSSENLVTVQIRIANDPARAPSPFDEKSTLAISRHVALIARNKHG